MAKDNGVAVITRQRSAGKLNGVFFQISTINLYRDILKIKLGDRQSIVANPTNGGGGAGCRKPSGGLGVIRSSYA